MSKLDKLKQAEQLYINEKQPLDVIGTKLDISHRTKEYDWDKKRFEKGREQELFNRELMNFAQKLWIKSPTILIITSKPYSQNCIY